MLLSLNPVNLPRRKEAIHRPVIRSVVSRVISGCFLCVIHVAAYKSHICPDLKEQYIGQLKEIEMLDPYYLVLQLDPTRLQYGAIIVRKAALDG